ncbi:MAG: bifunctional DNA-formamidopyrimidine glycosylase/DNA-(apurinic or apyrimidinic site) lyase [Bryobacteraceae bacterium]|nr:bifunctional DNA-formamidopyrimidine glycosylase/DNA-(apurinic or apyrimidinic site) lyase [Bryobacteraceae bacterium]
MPELPEVEAVCRKLRSESAGARVITMRFLRPNVIAPQNAREVESELAGAHLQSVDRRGKNILLRFSADRTLHVHLRMTGNLYVIADVRFRPASTRAWFELDDGRGIIFDDPRNLGRMRLYRSAELDAALGKLGVEPLSAEFSPAFFHTAASRSRLPAKLFLMDQRYVAGLGNIYAAEALFRAGIHPGRIISGLRRPKLLALHHAIVEVLRQAVESAVLAYSKPAGFTEAESFPCAVYDREGEPCERCRRKIKRIAQGGRSTYYCPGCQR